MNKAIIETDFAGPVISRHIYGHFAEHLGHCIYNGFWVGEDSDIPNTRGIRSDVVDALRKINIPNLRWPGGCFADDYHWRDGIGSRENRPTMVNTHWGGVTENNHFGTHEFMDLCDQLDCEPYICGNVGSGTVREMKEWVEYITFDGRSPMADLRHQNGRVEPWKLPFLGVGNENWGCGGNMRPEYYADLYRRYATFCRDLGNNKLNKIACGPNTADYKWTEVLMREVAKQMWGLSLHYYAKKNSPDNDISGSATEFEEYDWFRFLQKALRMNKLISRHKSIMDQYDPDKNVALVVDEWGSWYDVERGTNPGFLYQQNSLRDALIAGITLNIFNQHADRVRMANIAQTINVLQAMILTDGPKMTLTPTYHVFDMYQVHQNASLLPVKTYYDDYTLKNNSLPSINMSASRSEDGMLNFTFCNLDPGNSQDMVCQLRGVNGRFEKGQVLTAAQMTDHNTFNEPEAVSPTSFNEVKTQEDGFRVILPSKSVALLQFRGE